MFFSRVFSYFILLLDITRSILLSLLTSVKALDIKFLLKRFSSGRQFIPLLLTVELRRYLLISFFTVKPKQKWKHLKISISNMIFQRFRFLSKCKRLGAPQPGRERLVQPVQVKKEYLLIRLVWAAIYHFQSIQQNLYQYFLKCISEIHLPPQTL